ncbi:ferredoxin [Mycolicibacterium sp. BK556]|uniref:ferredoxin n=1 Tax=unclassified Mycolicibacterium TaxID=2636767 RepID=UPI001608FEDE|nr:ferredoxin [Mycolicibacterium sp. BK556]MBB3631642.1 ferredoxin [Mycolicibacterium sp. BK607]
MSRCRVTIDATRCAGIGICEGLAPDLFEVGDDDRAHLIGDLVDASRLAELDAVVANCPTQSLTVEALA